MPLRQGFIFSKPVDRKAAESIFASIQKFALNSTGEASRGGTEVKAQQAWSLRGEGLTAGLPRSRRL